MSGFMKAAALLSAMLLLCSVAGCCDALFKKPTVEVPPPVVEAPPPAPEPVEPPPAPPRPVLEPLPAPQPAPLPPAVTRSIEDLSEKYPGLFRLDRDKGLLYFNADATFDSGSAVVKPEARAALRKLATILNEDEVTDRRLTIIGHADTDRVVKPATISTLRRLGKTTDNMGLSEARSEAVATVLQVGGVDASRMVTMGRGETEPIADNSTPEGKARNRRVEIYLTPAKPGA